MVNKTIASHGDVLRTSSLVPSFRLRGRLLDHGYSVPIQRRELCQPLITFSFLSSVPG